MMHMKSGAFAQSCGNSSVVKPHSQTPIVFIFSFFLFKTRELPPPPPPPLGMPTGAGFGVGAVVSILHKVLKPRNLATNTFGNDYQLGRTADFVVRELLEEVVGQPPQARVSSPSYRVDDEPILFTVAWGCCKIVTTAPEGSRAQVQCPVCADNRLPHAFIDVLHRFEVARAQLLLCGIFQRLRRFMLMK